MRLRTILLTVATLGISSGLRAHVPPVAQRFRTPTPAAPIESSARLVMSATFLVSAPGSAPALAAAFQAFPKTVNVRWDEQFLYVEAKGLPDHPLMVGIKSWQQQVPIPQNYVGASAWRIPLRPVPAKEPMSAKNHFLRGAIALAANGVPIFNALNNRGDDALLAGELDDFGGHCGKADDYHYHVAPLHLEKAVGPGRPIAVALDGYPIYGLAEPDGAPVGKLDDFGGHETNALGYHYHAQKKYPYINGGFHGEVREVGGQVDPQPSATHARRTSSSYTQAPLRGALIRDFKTLPDGKGYELGYTLGGKSLSVRYTQTAEGWTFVYSKPDGTTVTESYKAGEGRGGPGGPGGRRPRREEGGEGRPGGESVDGDTDVPESAAPVVAGVADPEKDGGGQPEPESRRAPGGGGDRIPESKTGGSGGDRVPESVGAREIESFAPAGGEVVEPESAEAVEEKPADAQPGPGGPAARKKGGPQGAKGGDKPGMAKPGASDTISLNVYADNWFILYINGKLRVVDPIEYMPHNVVSVDILPEYPMTIAVLAMDNADPKTGLEYGNHIGDAGLIIRFGDGTVTNAKWKARSFFKGPLNHDVANPKVRHDPIPANWFAVDFDDSQWAQATEYTQERVGPKESYFKAEAAFKGARFIWSEDLDLDNTVIFRTKVEAPAGYRQRWTQKSEMDPWEELKNR